MTEYAVVIRERGLNLDGKYHHMGAVLRLPRNQFDDLEGVGVVRGATVAEVSREVAERSAAKRARKQPRVATAKSTPTDNPALSSTAG